MYCMRNLINYSGPLYPPSARPIPGRTPPFWLRERTRPHSTHDCVRLRVFSDASSGRGVAPHTPACANLHKLGRPRENCMLDLTHFGSAAYANGNEVPVEPESKKKHIRSCLWAHHINHSLGRRLRAFVAAGAKRQGTVQLSSATKADKLAPALHYAPLRA